MQPLSMPVLRSTAAALALGTFAWAAPAVAQDTEAPVAVSSLKIDQVTVTARKREEAAQSVPVPITALTTQLRSSTIRDLRDLNGFAPNVNISQEVGRASAAAITIRGISPVRTDDNSFDAPVAVAIDGIFLGTLAGTVLENFDLERIEVLRGPQGTLFGKNTVGGVVNVVRSRPTGEWGAKLKYTTGSWDQQEFRGVLNAPLIEGKLAAKAFFTNLQRDGYIKNDFLGINQPQQDYQNYGLTFLFTPNDWFEATLTVEKFEDSSQIGGFLVNGNVAPGVVPAPPAGDISPNLSGGLLSCLFAFVPCRTFALNDIPDTINPDLANPGKIDTEAVTLNMRAEVSENITLVSVTGYRKTSEDRIYDFDGTSANFITIDRENDIEQFSEEFRFEGSWETDNLGNIDIVAGVYYSRTEFDQDWRTGGEFWDFVGILSGYSLNTNTWNADAGGMAIQAAAEAIHGVGVTPVGACLARSPLGTLDPIFGNTWCEPGLPDAGFGPGFVQRLFEEQTTESIAFFGQVDWEIFEGFTATAGMRWTEETKDFRAGQAYLAPLARDREFGFPGFSDLSNKWTEVTPTFGLSYQFTDDLLVYASYSKGFHSGGFFGVNQNVADFERDQYDPEFAKNWELGIKSQWFENRIQINVSAFRNDFKDKQEASVQVDPTSNTVATVFSNVADAVYQGIEFELQAVVTENISVFGSVGYLDAKYGEFFTDIDPTDGMTIIEDASFLTPRNAPEWTFGFGGTFTMMVGNGGELELYAKYDRVSAVEGDLLNANFVASKARENLVASLTYRWQQYAVTVFGRNLTNDRFETIALINPLFAAGTINPGASWGVEVEAEF